MVLSVAPASAQQSAFLESLRRSRDTEVGVAFGLSAFLGKLKEATQRYGDGKERWLLTFAADDADYGAGIMEMSTSGYSADDIATLRARLPFLLPSVELAPETLAKLFAQAGTSQVLSPHGPRISRNIIRAGKDD